MRSCRRRSFAGPCLLVMALALAPAGPAGLSRAAEGEKPGGSGSFGSSGKTGKTDSSGSKGSFSHARWDKILKANVSPEGWVGYPRVKQEFAGELKAYLEELAAADLAALKDPKERMTFWINAYNAVCIQFILDYNAPAKVPKSRVFGPNIFTEEKYKVAGKVRPLDEIEHQILRKEFKDNRIHAAIVCAASSCPRLRPEAFDPARLDQQLDEECRSWINVEKNKRGERKNYLDRERKTYYVSEIFEWFQADFGGSDAGVLEFVKRFADDEARAFLEENPGVRVKYLAYDWSLNSQG